MLYIRIMDLRARIYQKGLKVVWIAEQIGVNYNSLRVYLNNPSIMPEEVSDKIKKLIA